MKQCQWTDNPFRQITTARRSISQCGEFRNAEVNSLGGAGRDKRVVITLPYTVYSLMKANQLQAAACVSTGRGSTMPCGRTGIPAWVVVGASLLASARVWSINDPNVTPSSVQFSRAGGAGNH
jgi:hypothetical protein